MKHEKLALPTSPFRVLLLTSAIFLGAFVLFAGAATACRHEPGHGPSRALGARGQTDPSSSFGYLERRLALFELDAQTRTAIELVLNDAREDAEEVRGRLDHARAALRQALEQEPPSEAEVLARAEEAGRIGIELRKDQLGALLRIRAKLTPEQRTKLRAGVRGRGRECARR